MRFKPLSNSEIRAIAALNHGASPNDAYVEGFSLARHWKEETIEIKASRFFGSDRVQYFMEQGSEPVKKNKHIPGPAGSYRPEYTRMMLEYFDVQPFETIELVNEKTGAVTVENVVNPLPTKAGFAAKIGVCRDSLWEWSHKKDPHSGELVNPEFAAVYHRSKDFQEHVLVTNTLMGKYQASFAQFAAKNILGWRDSKDLTLAGVKDKPIASISREMTPEEAAAIYKEALDKGKD